MAVNCMIILGSKWMIYSCILSLTVGVAIVSPLLILNTQIDPFPENPQVHPNPQSQMGQVAVNIASVKAELKTLTPPSANNTETETLQVFNERITVSATKYLNSNESLPDAESDYFLMQFFTENGTLIKSRTLSVGTAYNRAFMHEHQLMLQLIDNKQMNWNFSNYICTSAAFFGTWSIGTTQKNSQESGASVELDLAALIDTSQTLTLSLFRIGVATAKDGLITASVINPEFVENVTLTRSGNTFTYTR
jgi:hypothetical protein